ncbi:phage portal protein [Kitasatospora sp. NPDC058046]|uniref:phage portal protein n=1 Tax=Kitasatospora sp. NPDC058046 TaxID=3346312 RepID=UPI0036D99089
MALWRRRTKAPEGGLVVTPDGLPVAAKASPVTDGTTLATFPSLAQPWAYDGRVIVPDPGIPLMDYAADPMSIWAGQPSVRKVVDYIARNLAGIPWRVYRRVSDTDRRRVTDHPVAQLLASPSPTVTAYRLWHSLAVDLLLYDRWCARVLPSADTASGWEIIRVPAPRMRLVSDGWGRVAEVVVQGPDGQQIGAPPRGYLFDHGYASHGQVNGTSPMVTLAQILAESAEAVEYRRQVWRNGARVPAVIERPAEAPDWSDGAKSRFQESFNRFVGKGGAAGGTPILEDGMKLVKSDAFAPKDTHDLEGRQLTDAEVASAYHIPPELVGARAGTYSNVDAFRQMLYTHALGPNVSAAEQVLNLLLLPTVAPGESDLYIEAGVEAKLRGSFLEQAQVLQSAVGAPYMLRSEARAVQNLPFVEGTDGLVTPLNVLVGGLASPRDTAPKSARPRAKSARPDGLGTFDAERDAFSAALTAWAERQAEGLLERAGSAKADAPPDFYSLWAESSPARQAQLAALIQAHGLRLAQIGAWSVLDLYNPDADGWSADVMDGWLAAAARSHAEQFEQAGYAAALSSLGAEDGWQTGLKTAMTGWVGRAAVRAVTSATEARSFGGHDAAGASGLTYKVWNTGSKARSTHARLDGDKVLLDDVFGNGLRWPGDGRGEDAETANCNCRLTYERGE